MAEITPDTVLHVLHRHIGADNGISVRKLAAAIAGPGACAQDERRVRHAVVELREQGEHVCAHPRHGYYMAANEEELLAECEWMYSRAMCSLRQIAAMRRQSLPDLRGQLRLPT